MVAIGVYDPLAPVIFFVLLPMMRSTLVGTHNSFKLKCRSSIIKQGSLRFRYMSLPVKVVNIQHGRHVSSIMANLPKLYVKYLTVMTSCNN